MSSEIATGAAALTQTGEVTAVARVEQIQALIAQAQGTYVAPTASASSASSDAGDTASSASAGSTATSFATALERAEASQTSTTDSTDMALEDTTAPAEMAASGDTTAPAEMAASGDTTAPADMAAPEGASAYEGLIDQAAARYGIDPAILHGLIQQESGFDPSARSSAGALGMTQLMPGTAASLGVTEPLNPEQSIDGGALYLSQQLAKFGGNLDDAIAAYNAGPGAVSQYGGVPPYPETQDYVSKVLEDASAYRQGSVGTSATGAPA